MSIPHASVRFDMGTRPCASVLILGGVRLRPFQILGGVRNRPEKRTLA